MSPRASRCSVVADKFLFSTRSVWEYTVENAEIEGKNRKMGPDAIRGPRAEKMVLIDPK